MVSKVWVETPDVPVSEGDYCVGSSRSVVCRVTRIYDDGAGGRFAVFEPVKRDGTRNYNFRGWSGGLRGYTRVVKP